MLKNKHRYVLITLGVLIAALLIFWGVNTFKSDRTQQPENPFGKILRGIDQDASSKVKTKSGRTFIFASARAKSLLDGSMEFLAVENFDGYLKRNSRSARSLAAVYLLTMDTRIIDELKNHLDSPDALLCLVSNPFTTEEEKLEYAKRYCELKPDEMQGYMIAAAAARSLYKESGDVLALIQKGMFSDKVSVGFESTNDLREALGSTGMTRLDSEVYLIKINHFAGSLLNKEADMIGFGSKTEMSSATTEESKSAIINKYLSVSESIYELQGYANGLTDSTYFNVVAVLIRQLPPDAELGEGNGTVADYLGKIGKEKMEWKMRRDFYFDAMRQISPEKFEQYIEQRIQNGETAALTWLINEGHH